MNRFGMLLIVVLGLSTLLSAQYQERQPVSNIKAALLPTPSPNLLSGLFNANHFYMHHTFSMSYASAGGESLLLNRYMNSIHYQFSIPISLRLKLGISQSPYNTLNNHPVLNQPNLFGGAEMIYTPSDNFQLKISIDSTPYKSFFNNDQ